MSGKERENFGSRFAVIMAMAGSAIGLGNIWRFPYMVGEHGGAAFIIIYIIATLLISLPVFFAEVIIGRRSRTSSYGAMSKLSGGKMFWKGAGLLTVIIPLIIMSYYSVIGGWAVEYLIESCKLTFTSTSPEAASSIFEAYTSETWMPLVTAGIFLAACGLVVMGGVRSGIEKFSKITMPVLFVLVVLIMVYSLSLPGSADGVSYLLKPDFSKLDSRSIASAMGQSFYSLSLGMGAIITYGSYVSRKENLVVSGFGTAASDLLFAILAGFAIMPAVFATPGVDPQAGPGLIFQTIPFVFSTMAESMPFISTVVAILFFLTIVVAAMTSNMSMYEVGVSYLMERYGLKRWLSCVLIFVICGGMGVFSCLFPKVLDTFDFVSSNILLAIAGFLSVLFVGWFMKKSDVWDELTNGGSIRGRGIFNIVYFLMKWVAPVAVAIIFVTGLLPE